MQDLQTRLTSIGQCGTGQRWLEVNHLALGLAIRSSGAVMVVRLPVSALDSN
jgi:hypothetical protein